jgi:hypothetical protein
VLDIKDDGSPETISMSFKCPKGIQVSGEELIPKGFMYANLRVGQARDGGLRLYDGRLTVKEDVKTSFLLSSFDGLISEYKIVGVCEAEKHKDS